MEVATLTATLVAETAKFTAAMKDADKQLAEARGQIESTEKSADALSRSLDAIGVSRTKLEAARGALKRLQDAVDGLERSAVETSTALKDVELTPSQAVETAAVARREVDSLHDIRDAALGAAAAEKTLGLEQRRWSRRGPSGQFMSREQYLAGRGLGITPEGDLVKTFARAMAEAAAREGVIPSAKQPIPVGPASDPKQIYGYTKDGSLVPIITDTRAVPVIQYQGPIGPELPADYRAPVRDLLVYQDALATLDRMKYEAERAARLAAARQRGPDQVTIIEPSGRVFEGAPGSRRTVGPFGRGSDEPGPYTSMRSSLLAAALARFSGSSDRNTHSLRDLINTLKTELRVGEGKGIPIPLLGFGAGFGGRGIGFGRRWRFGRGLPPFGSLMAMGGFGAERGLTSLIGILGSMAGGLIGGGLLGMGALGTTLVGAGTNLAGVGQAIGDTHMVSKDLGALSDAITQYGKNSAQAAQAQQQLNADLQSFSPVARNAVLAAAQTSQAFKAMFDKLTGPAEKIGAEIINQAMHVGMKFLPTIAKFAQQNMHILQNQLNRPGQNGLFNWLQMKGDPNKVLQDTTRLNQAIKEFGANSVQAAQAQAQLTKDAGKVGGLGLFIDLEKIFQRNFPRAIHAGTMAFELLLKVVDIAAHQTGHFITVLDQFFTRLNNPSHYGALVNTVDNLIGLFRSWLHMFVQLGRVVFDIFKPSVGLGQAFAEMLSRLFGQLDKYLKQSGTQNVLHSIFNAHLYQLIGGIGTLLMSLMPIVEGFISAFLQMEAVISSAFGAVFKAVGQVIHELNKIPGFDKILGWALAFRLVFAANALLLGKGIAPLLARIPIVGKLFSGMALAASRGILALGGYIMNLIRVQIAALIAAWRGTGAAAAASAAEADAAVMTEAEAVAAATASLETLAAAEVGVGTAAIEAEAAAVPALTAIGAAALSILGPIAAVAAALMLLNKLEGTDGPKRFHRISRVHNTDNLVRGSDGHYYILTPRGRERISNAEAARLQQQQSQSVGTGRHGHRAPPNDPPTSHLSKSQQQMAKFYRQSGIPYKIVHGRVVPDYNKLYGTPKPIQGAGQDPSVPTGYLAKQRAEMAQARLDIAQGHVAAAKKLLELEKKQLAEMLKHTKNQAKRAAIMRELTSVDRLLAHPTGSASGFLAKQQQEIDRARIDLANGHTKAALKLLELDKQQLQAMLRTVKTQQQRTEILNKLAEVSSMIKSAKNQGSIGGGTNWALPLKLQMEMARADAQAALLGNNGPTAAQIQLAKQAKAAAMRAINSHKLSMQQLIDAWNIVGQANQVLAQQLQNKLNMYHQASTDALTDSVKGLTAAQELQLREGMAQREAHRGYVPNQGYQSGPGSQPASPHHRTRGMREGPGHHPHTSPTPGYSQGNIIIHGDVILNGVQDKGKLWAELKSLDRRHHQRSGGRR